MYDMNEIKKKARPLPKERWLQAAQDIEQIAPAVAEKLQKINMDGKGNEDALDFVEDMMLAVTALYYVAECATDKCLITPFPETRGMN